MGGSTNYNSRDRKKLRARLSERQNHRCCLCGWPLNEPPVKGLDTDDWTATFEHATRRGNGGRLGITNLAISHKICNKMRDKWDWTDYANMSAQANSI